MKEIALISLLWPKNFSVLYEYLKNRRRVVYTDVGLNADSNLHQAARESGGCVERLGEQLSKSYLATLAANARRRETEILGTLSNVEPSLFSPGNAGTHLETVAAMTNHLSPHLFSSIYVIEALNLIRARHFIELMIVNEDWTPFPRAAVLWARRNGIPTIHLSHSCIIGQPVTIHSRIESDCMAVFGERGREGFLDLGISKTRMPITGNPAWDGYSDLANKRDEVRGLVFEKYQLRRDIPLVVFFTTWDQKQYAGYDSSNYDQTVEAFLRCCIQLGRLGRPVNGVVKDRPSNAGFGEIRVQELAKREGLTDRDYVVYATEDTEALIVSADIVISINSNISFEAMLAAVPAVNLVDKAGWYPMFSAEDGIVQSQPEQLSDVVAHILNDDKFRKEIVETMRSRIGYVNLSNDGGAAKRVADLMGKMAIVPPVFDEASVSRLAPALVPSRKGTMTLEVRGEDGTIRTLHSPDDPEREAGEAVVSYGQGFFVVLGLGLGYHVAELFRQHGNPTVVVVEPIIKLFEMAKEQRPLSKYLDKVSFIVGKSPDDAIQEIRKYYLKSGLASLTLFPWSAEVSAFPSYFRPIITVLESRTVRGEETGLSYPKFKEETLTVTLLGNFLSKEVENSLLRLGHRAIRFPMENGENILEVISRLTSHIREDKPDFIFTKNHQGFDPEGVLAGFLKSIGLPAASWWVQCPNLNAVDSGESISDYIAVFTWNKLWIEKIKRFGFESATYLPLATDETIFSPRSLAPSESGRYQVDVGFVGKSYLASVEQALPACPQILDRLSEKVAQRWVQSKKSYDETIKGLTLPEREQISAVTESEKLGFKEACAARASMLYRLSCIQALAGFKTAIFGDAGWKRLLDKKFQVEPELDYDRETPLFYNACRINFNTTHFQMRAVAHQKVFDVLACGGFLLTDYQEALEEFFEVGKEVIPYKSIGEIPSLIRFYLKNSSARDAIAKRGHQRVLAEHTYTHRINQITRVMRERYQ